MAAISNCSEMDGTELRSAAGGGGAEEGERTGGGFSLGGEDGVACCCFLCFPKEVVHATMSSSLRTCATACSSLSYSSVT
jgi:hypothetical protein